jgi:YhcH/YjgK/YiaL family protein
MIFGHISQLPEMRPMLPPALRAALEHLRDTDFNAKPAGEYELQGQDIFVKVIDVVTKPIAQGKPEAHRRYADVQFLVRGRERIGCASDNGKRVVAEDYLAERDLLFFADEPDEVVMTLRPGSFAVFLPNDIHRPAAAVDSPEPIRKVVVKINVDLLK